MGEAILRELPPTLALLIDEEGAPEGGGRSKNRILLMKPPLQKG
jgi:hypothetical protein